jgi:hypothetical protein
MEDRNFDILYNNTKYNIELKVEETSEWWLSNSNESKLYTYIIHVNNVEVAKFYNGSINENKIADTNLFEIYKFVLDKLESIICDMQNKICRIENFLTKIDVDLCLDKKIMLCKSCKKKICSECDSCRKAEYGYCYYCTECDYD